MAHPVESAADRSGKPACFRACLVTFFGQVRSDIHQVSFLTSVRPILSANSRRQSRGVYPPGKGHPFGRIVASRRVNNLLASTTRRRKAFRTIYKYKYCH